MRPPMLAVGAGSAVWLTLALMLPPLAGLPAKKVFALQLILTLTGALLAAAVIWYLRRKQQAAQPAAQPLSGEPVAPAIEHILREARAKLAASALGRSASPAKMPVVIVMGSAGAAKTTTVVRSGLEPELLAGQVHQEGAVLPTSVGNVWLVQNALFLELASALQADPKTWQRLAKEIQPGKLEAALGGGSGAPRAVVVCYECDQLLKPGAAETAAGDAKKLRAQLFELAGRLGSNVPVYVLFTKLDRLAFFPEFVRHFDSGETAQILGATLGTEKVETGVYGERESARLSTAFQELAISLSDRRTELLTREPDPDAVLSAYEFPREFRKLRNAGVRFLLELCRPSQLSIGPFLRGFYFTGVRPVLVTEEIAAEIAPRRHSSTAAINPDATNIFVYQRSAVQAESDPSVAQSVRRQVPEWVFLPGFYRDVVLGDRSGSAASASSVRTRLARRLLLASVLGLSLLFALLTLVSFLKNRELEARVSEASAAVSSDRATAQTVSFESLHRLDMLRQALLELVDYQQTHPPLSMRWGLYTGDQLLPAAHSIYFDRFRSLLLSGLTAGFLDTMRSWPAAPPQNADYGFGYNTLKAYLETTSNHEKATLQFLPPLLEQRWVAGQPIDPAKVALARRQFDFYTSQLIQENPYSSSSNTAVVQKARAYLAQFAGAARVYQALLTEANQANKSLVFNRQFPGSADIVVNALEVPGGFTKPGFTFIDKALKDPSKYVSGERWVLGDQFAVSGDMSALVQQIRDLYYRDYIAAWRDYLRKSAVRRYANLPDAVRKLAVTSGPTSPLLALFWLASQNTDVNAPPVQQAFKPLHAFMPATNVDQYVGPTNNSYMASLTALQNSLDQVAKLPPEQSQAAADQTQSAAGTAMLSARQAGLTLGIDQDAHIETTILKLITDPITYVDAVSPHPGNALNAAGAAFCSGYRLLMAKYPFDTGSKAKASIDEVNAVFRPQQGTLWQFYSNTLSKFLVKQGSVYVPLAGGKPELSGRFVSFFNNAARFSNALYANGASQDPKLQFALQPAFSSDLQSVSLTINGQTANLQPGSPAEHFSWPGAASGVRMVAKSGSEMTYPSYDGLWGVFEFFYDADKLPPSPEWMLKGGRSDKPVTSPLTNQPVAVHFNLDMLGGPPVFQKGYFRELGCVSEVAKP